MWPNPQETAELVTFTEEICDGKFHFLCSVGLHLDEKLNFNTHINKKIAKANKV